MAYTGVTRYSSLARNESVVGADRMVPDGFTPDLITPGQDQKYLKVLIRCSWQ